MNASEIEAFRAQYEALERKLLELMLAKPRHPRSYKGAATPRRLILTGEFDCADGRTRVSDADELTEGEGETPESDLFLRDYDIVGQRRGGSFGDVLLKLVPIIAPGSSGWVDVLGTVFGKKR